MFQTIFPCYEYTPSPIAIVCHIRFSIQHSTCRQKSGMIFASMNNNAFLHLAHNTSIDIQRFTVDYSKYILVEAFLYITSKHEKKKRIVLKIKRKNNL